MSFLRSRNSITTQILTGSFAAIFFGLGGLTGCSSSTTDTGNPSSPIAPRIQAPAIDFSNPPPFVPAAMGTEIQLQKFGPKVYLPVEGTFTDSSFQRLMKKISSHNSNQQKELLKSELEKVFQKLGTAGALNFKTFEEVAYFTFLLPYPQSSTSQVDLLSGLKGLQFNHQLIFNPVVMDRQSLAAIRELSAPDEELKPQAGASAPRDDLSAFSGLNRIHAPEFTQLAEAAIGSGVKVNGDSVNLGITDSGITLHHPAFQSADGTRNRIIYLKDFTREGRLYFSPRAKFRATAPSGPASILDGLTMTGAGLADDRLVIDAEVIVTPPVPMLPPGDKFMELKQLEILVSPELKALLLAPDTSARFGVLRETVFNSEKELVDINGNQKNDDELPVIAILGKTAAEDRIYINLVGDGDFRDIKPLSDWNGLHETLDSGSEKFGVEFKDDKLPASDGKGEILVHSASIVGFDPGQHGSHVAGIAAGSKTLSNDRLNTLARGVAPEAKILVNRICSNNNGCNGTEAMIDLAISGGADVINMSIGGLGPYNDGFGVQETIINRLTQKKNTLFVVAAGNEGPGKQTVDSPSTARLSVSVGASASYGMIQRQYQWPASASPIRDSAQDQDFMLFFSSRGPTAAGGFKPNLVAPGTELSSLPLNSMPGHRAGLDVFWGTSMASPTVTGAFALFLDAIRKFNLNHPDQKLPTDVTVLRRVLLESAAPFDVNSYDPQTGVKNSGQYTWIDEGLGLIDLVAAWKKLLILRDHPVRSAVLYQGAPVELDYKIVVPDKTPNGNSYDGTIAIPPEAAPKFDDPVFGTGLYIDYAGTETLRPVHLSRGLPQSLAQAPEVASLNRDLETTADEFILKTVFYGSDQPWLKAGVLDQLGGDASGADCDQMPSANLMLIGKGVDIVVDEKGAPSVTPYPASVLNVCLNRKKIREELPPGDHGAIISAYRVVDGKTETVPSFWVPVYLQVPNKTLEASTAYQTEGTVPSFGVKRNYVKIPKGTSLLRVTLEVPPLKLAPTGLPVPGEQCSGVELMALLGTNTAKAFEERKDARIANCDPQGRPITDPAKLKVSFASNNPLPGTYDLHVFGQYRYANSHYRLRADYLTAAGSIAEISGNSTALTGSFDWSISENSMTVQPDNSKSTLTIKGLSTTTKASVTKGASVYVEGALGLMRSYAAGTQSVTISTGDAKGSDLDLFVFECDATATVPTDSSCQIVGKSAGPTDVESVTFTPAAGKVYLERVDGFEIHGNGQFSTQEKIELANEKGTINVSGTFPSFHVGYGFTDAQVATSPIMSMPLFQTGKCEIYGELILRTADEVTLFALPVKIHH